MFIGGKMDRNNFERDVYESLRKYFEQSDNETNEEGRLLSAIPPEMINAVVEMLVAPVIASLTANYIIQKCASCKVLEIDCAQVEELKLNAENKIKKKMKKVGKGEKESKKMMQKVSTEITVKIDFKSTHEMNACIEGLEKMLQTDGKLKEISIDKKYK